MSSWENDKVRGVVHSDAVKLKILIYHLTRENKTLMSPLELFKIQSLLNVGPGTGTPPADI